MLGLEEMELELVLEEMELVFELEKRELVLGLEEREIVLVLELALGLVVVVVMIVRMRRRKMCLIYVLHSLNLKKKLNNRETYWVLSLLTVDDFLTIFVTIFVLH